MRRIGIVGSDNSHAVAYSRLVNRERVAGDDVQVVAIWGQEPERTAEVAELGAIPEIAPSLTDLIGNVDLVFVVDRHGDLHRDHALPFLEAGIPTYVDKPLAIALDDCRQMIATAQRTGTFLTSMSSLRITPETNALAARLPDLGEIRAAQFAGPADPASPYGGLIFYATHTIEIALRLLGDDLQEVRAHRIGPTIVVDGTWSGERQATLTLLANAHYCFHATIFGIDGFTAAEIHANDDSYAEIVRSVLRAVDANRWPLDARQLLMPIAATHAIEASLASDGAPVSLADILA
ncbi:MAG: Gfo/Idh/MocA family oxidoreductase [Thermomicrobiales bacterium]